MRCAPPLLALALVAGACGGDGSPADERADQVRDAAEEADLAGEVTDVLLLAARGVDGTFQVTYAGEEGTSIVISQRPPDRRVDVVAGTKVVSSQVVRGGVAYRCEPPEDDPSGPLACRRTAGSVDAPGAFTEEALDAFTEALTSDDLELRVEERTIAEATATCLVADPGRGPTDGTGPGVETICLSAAGAQLLVDTAGERLVAEAYTTDVPEGTFET